jgi:ethanolamine utilization protein EutA
LLADVRAFGLALGSALTSSGRFQDAPLVLLTQHNIGKAIGNYATSWGNAGHNLIVIDEIPLRNAQFVNIGALRHGVVPVSFYGMR